MAFGDLGHGSQTRPLAQINMIPLIDVMLVLLIVFMITAPLLTHRLGLELPQASSLPQPANPDAIRLEIQADGTLTWNAEPLTDEALAQRMAAAAAGPTIPELHVLADRRVPYGRVAQVLAGAGRAGLNRIGFVSEPAPQP
ncbi:biopolymer transporter ExbD [uncultured Thiodictyon sp.]|uniref:ExbD/TolR family protein n=1 Tax=uncultured Thiodictyon sp. TaxID=1846217 RepID=UPI0025EAC44D|nr:biopolymer transporter ExbD [uncultured Thiodictyon sp.]